MSTPALFPVVKEMIRLVEQLKTKPHLRRRNRELITAQLQVLTSKAANQFFAEMERRGICSLWLRNPEELP